MLLNVRQSVIELQLNVSLVWRYFSFKARWALQNHPWTVFWVSPGVSQSVGPESLSNADPHQLGPFLLFNSSSYLYLRHLTHDQCLAINSSSFSPFSHSVYPSSHPALFASRLRHLPSFLLKQHSETSAFITDLRRCRV